MRVRGVFICEMGGNIKYDDYVKAPGAEHNYTAEQIREIMRCKKDVIYFIKTYIKIVTDAKGVVNFEPYEYQEHLLQNFEANRFNICLLSRQSGKSTIVAAYALWYACFNGHKNIGIVSNKADSAKSFLSRLKYMYELLPGWLKPGVPRWAEQSIEFDNHTKIQTAATSKDSFRGEPMGMLICDEFAFVDPQWKADEFWASNYPTVSASPTSKIIIISTPNGMNNKFHTLYSDASNGRNTFVASRFDYRAVPGRTEEWAAEQMKNLGRVKFNQEFGCEFLGSSATVLDPQCLERLMNEKRDPDYLDMKDRLFVYEKPIESARYIMGVDTAKGTGEDYSVIHVFRVHKLRPVKMEQVATFRDNYTDVYTFSEIVNRVSYYYNNAQMMVENNNEGSTVVNRLWWDFENENLINTGTKERDLGIRATPQTKSRAVLFMKKLLEDKSITIYNHATVEELTDFIDKGNGKFGGENLHDDTVAALYWALYILELDVLDEDYQFVPSEESPEDAWGILADVDGMIEDWSWMELE